MTTFRPVRTSFSLKRKSFPRWLPAAQKRSASAEYFFMIELLNATRELRSQHKISQTKVLEGIRLDLDGADDGTKQMVRDLVGSIQSATRCKEVSYGPAEYATAVQGVKLEILAAE